MRSSSSSGRGSLFGSSKPQPASSSGSRGYATSAAAPTATRPPQHAYAQPPARPQPAPQHAPPQHAAYPAQQQQAQGGLGAGLLGGVMQGMAFGGGSAIAHRAIDGIMGPRTVIHDHQGQPQEIPSDVAPALGVAPAQGNAYNSATAEADRGACSQDLSQFTQCMSQNNNDFNQCAFLYDILSQCRRSVQENRQWA